jgi:DNA-binding transcriptional ArsR family regulator
MNKVFKALSDPTRRRVLQLLRQGPMTAGELAEHFPVSKPTMSAHFTVLREAGLVVADKEGKTVTYQLCMSVLEEALMAFAQLFGMEIQLDDEDSFVVTGGTKRRPVKSEEPS